MKITKSELKEMIREALREELGARKYLKETITYGSNEYDGEFHDIDALLDLYNEQNTYGDLPAAERSFWYKDSDGEYCVVIEFDRDIADPEELEDIFWALFGDYDTNQPALNNLLDHSGLEHDSAIMIPASCLDAIGIKTSLQNKVV